MPGTKEIRSKIASVKSTQKITKAMQMVATSKMRRAQERMRQARPYAEKMRNVIGHLTEANPDYRHPFLQPRDDVKGVGIIVVASDRGLAGALNANVFKQTLYLMRDWQGKSATPSLCLIGAKGVIFFRRLGVPILANVSHLGDQPHIKDLIGTVKVMLDAYREGKIDRLFLVNAQFVNTMTQKPVVEQLLPDPAHRHRGTAGALGLHLRAGGLENPRRAADALHRVPGLPRGRRERRLRAGGADGGNEGRVRQRQRSHQRAAAHLQQGPPGRDHQGARRNRRRSCRGMIFLLRKFHG